MKSNRGDRLTVDVAAQRMSDLVCLDLVYEAAITGEWRDSLGAILAVLSADRGALVVIPASDQPRILTSRDMDEAAEAELTAWVTQSWPVKGDLAAVAEVPALASGGRTVGVCAAAPIEAEGWILCCTGWTAPQPPQSATRLRQLTSHVARAVSIHHRLQSAAGHAEVAAAVLDRVTLGAVLVDERAWPILANRAAQRMAREEDGFEIGPRGLAATSAADTKALHRLVADVSRRHGGRLGERGTALRLERPSGRSPYEVLVLPLPRGDHADIQPDAAAVVFVTDPERDVQTPEQFIRDLYDLTPAEARLAMLLAEGQGLTEAADLLGVSRNTAHTHLSRIFLKTGTSRQSDLVRRLLTAPARLAAEETSGHHPVAD